MHIVVKYKRFFLVCVCVNFQSVFKCFLSYIKILSKPSVLYLQILDKHCLFDVHRKMVSAIKKAHKTHVLGDFLSLAHVQKIQFIKELQIY
jgi:hypothetical protein